MNIACLIACHNRREKTLACLRALADAMRQLELRVGVGEWNVHVFLVDDGSADGTSESVQEWADQVKRKGEERITLHLIRASGSLFWARGMALAWREALKYEEKVRGEGEERMSRSSHSANNQQLTTNNFFTHFLWLNDDVMLAPDALETLLKDHAASGARSVVVGICHNRGGDVSYGATDKTDTLIWPDGHPQVADGWLTGNVVLVPHGVCERVGILDESFTHARADYDYAERLRRAGIPFCASSRFVGECTNNWLERMSGMSLAARVSSLWKPGYYNLRDLWLIRFRYHGLFRAVVSCLHMIFIALRRVR